MKRILLFCLALFPFVAFSQNTLPTVESINSRYYNLLTEGKSRLSVKITVKELHETLEPLANQLYQNGDTLLARQLNDLHATLIYDKTIDSVNILISPFEVDESSPMFEGSKNIKIGYHDMISGAFMQFRSILIDGLLSSNLTENGIKLVSDKITVDVIEEGSQTKYTFSNDYKEVEMSGSFENQQLTGLITAREIGNQLVFDYQEMVTPQMKSILNISYFQEGKTILPKEIVMKNEIKPMNIEFTLVFSEWKFE